MTPILRAVVSALVLCTICTLGFAQITVSVDPVRDTYWFLPLNVSITDTVTCSVSGNDKAKLYFRVYPNTCLLTYRTSLEADPATLRYDVTVDYFSASDPNNVSTIDVTVIAQRNLHAPTFTPSAYSVSVDDSELPGTSVLSVTALDQDVSAPANTIYYQFSQTSDFFEINGATGEIRIKKMLSLDVARPAVYTLVTLAVDQGSRPLTASTTVVISVNRNTAPVFLNANTYSRVVSEDARVLQYVILQVIARDSDNPAKPNGKVSYSISSDAANRVFHMNASSGEITPRVELKFAPSYSWLFDVVATDEGTPPLTATATVSIQIATVGLPQFFPSEYEVTIPESFPPGATVLTITANDPIGSELDYERIGDGLAVDYFNVNSSTGLITLNIPLTRDTTYTLRYRLRVRAYRRSDVSAQAVGSVLINVIRNANSPSFSSPQLVYNVTDTLLPGHNIANISATDSDTGPPGTIQYSIDRTSFTPSYASSYFFINPSTGHLLLTSSLAADPQTPEYRFSVVARDGGVPPKSATVQVRVLVPRNLNAPVFPGGGYAVSVPENIAIYQPVINLTATDLDGDLVWYHIVQSPPDSFFFNIHPTTGQVDIARPLSTDTQRVYMLRVVATDNAASPRSSSTTVRVNVSRNPNPPVFQSYPSKLNISEYARPGTVVIRLTATDADGPTIPSGQLRYYLSTDIQTTPDYLRVDPTSGDVITLAAFSSPVAPPRLILRVIVTDRSVYPLSATTTILIDIVGNQHAPVFPVSADTLEIAGPGEVYKVIHTVTATDADSQDTYNRNTPNAEVVYSIAGTQEAKQLFRISETGDVYMVQPLDRNTAGTYSIDVVIRASDKGWKPKFSDMALNVTFTIQTTVAIGQIGFSQPVYYVTIRENPSATDLQQLDVVNLGTDNPMCTIMSGNTMNVFTVQLTVDRKACMLQRVWFGRSLDAEVQNSFQLRVRVEAMTFRGKRAVGDQCAYNSWREADIYIKVTDLNDNGPIFVFPQYPSTYQDPQTYFAAIPFTAKPLTDVIRVQADDYDSGSLGRVTYSMAATNSSLPFFVSPADGDIKTSLEFDQTSPRQYQLTVQAKDSPPNEAPLVSDAKLVINLIEDVNRFLLVVNNRTTKDVIVHYENIRQQLQTSYGHTVLIERIQAKRQTHLHGVTVFPDSTDIIFVIVGSKKDDNYRLLNNTSQATVGQIMSDETQTQMRSNIKTNLDLDVEDVLLAETSTSSTSSTSSISEGTSQTTKASTTTAVICEFPRRDINSGVTHGGMVLYTLLLSLIGYWAAY